MPEKPNAPDRLELAKQILRLAGENVPVQEIARRLSATEEEVRQILN